MEDLCSFLAMSSVPLCPWDSGCWQWEEAGLEKRGEVCPFLFHSWEMPPVEL
jgi:hypothetical protein